MRALHQGLVLFGAILCLGATLAANGALADETYSARQFRVEQGVYAVGFSPKGDRIAFATDADTVAIHDTLDGKQLANLKVHDAQFDGWSPDGTLFMVGTAKQLRFWTDEERRSGHAEQWEKLFAEPGN
jgi:LmbE family N-acetylglucosaminyl deacetylase